MSRRPRRRFSDVQKTKAVLAHVQDGVPVSQGGYRGEKDFGKTQLLTPSRPAQDDTDYKKRKQRKRFRKRADI